MKTTLILFLALTIILIATSLVFAQPSLPAAPSQGPIDGGLSLLAVAGGSYAWRKLRTKRNSGSEEPDV